MQSLKDDKDEKIKIADVMLALDKRDMNFIQQGLVTSKRKVLTLDDAEICFLYRIMFTVPPSHNG